MDRQPEAPRVWPGLQHPVGGMGRNDQMIARPQVDAFPGQFQHRPSFQQQHPFVLLLIVEDRIGGVTAEDALDPYPAPAPEILEEFARL